MYPGRVVDKKQKILTFQGQNESGGSNLLAMGFSKEACRLACAKMIILDELPFSFVEGRGFRQFCNVACPKFDPPSRRSIIRDIYQLYLDEKLQLKMIFTEHGQRVFIDDDNQVSTKASESAFSMGGRILDPFRSSLTPKLVELLVCTQNWFKGSSDMNRFFMKDVEYYDKLDEDILDSLKAKESSEGSMKAK